VHPPIAIRGSIVDTIETRSNARQTRRHCGLADAQPVSRDICVTTPLRERRDEGGKRQDAAANYCQQMRRGRAGGCPGILDRDRDLCPNKLMPEVKVTPFRFTDEELEVLGIIEGHTGIRSRTEALRQVLHEHERAQGDGVDVSEPTESKTQP
jgi:hypothetical protein